MKTATQATEIRIGYRPTGSTVGGEWTPHRYTEFDGIEEYLYAVNFQNDNEQQVAVKIAATETPATETRATETASVNLDSLWEMARRNTDRAAVLTPMYSVLGLSEDASEPPMVVVTTRESWRGASAIGGTETRTRLREIFGDKALMLPSSVHEVIVVPYDPAAYEDYCRMVKDINQAEVAADDVLADEAYVLHLATETETPETDDDISDEEWIPEF